MGYTTILASVSPAALDRFRSAPAPDPATGDRPALEASRVEQCPHDLTAVDIQPLGGVLAEAIDIGLPLRNDGWHPLRAPVVADPETVMARAMKLEDAWHLAEPELGGMMAEMLGPDIDRVRDLYAHASGRGDVVVSFLSAPDDPDKAARSLVPTLTIV